MSISTGRPNVTLTGLLPADPFVETYWVRHGGATVVTLESDDRITIRDPDGGQAGELTALSPDGGEDAAALGATADTPANVLRSLIGSGADGAAEVTGSLAGRGLNPTAAMAVRRQRTSMLKLNK